ncbi:MAG: DUF86 domain-containing protein [Dehalococcoidia bacterium]|nr:DUF86 domain-containing protein [Dehalococcoidia bacterium]
MKKDYLDYMTDISDAIEEVGTFTRGMDLEGFLADRKTINAVIRSLEVMGEAAKKIPDGLRQTYSDILWRRMAAMRDKLIHEYHGVDLEIVRMVVREELPPIKPLVEKALADMKEAD